MRVAINLESLVRGFGLELSEALSRYVLGGIMSRSEARRAIGLPGRADTDPMFQPVNVETTDQAQARQDRADAAQEATAAQATAANSNVAASLTRSRRPASPRRRCRRRPAGDAPASSPGWRIGQRGRGRSRRPPPGAGR